MVLTTSLMKESISNVVSSDDNAAMGASLYTVITDGESYSLALDVATLEYFISLLYYAGIVDERAYNIMEVAPFYVDTVIKDGYIRFMT